MAILVLSISLLRQPSLGSEWNTFYRDTYVVYIVALSIHITTPYIGPGQNAVILFMFYEVPRRRSGHMRVIYSYNEQSRCTYNC